jgi:hypothetical protein
MNVPHCKSPEDVNKPSPYVGDLLQVAHHITGAPVSHLNEMCQILLHQPPYWAGEVRGQSGLNWDGSPLQFLVSTRRKECIFRLIGDPAFFHSDPLTRFDESIAALQLTLDAGNAGDLHDACQSSLTSAFPKNQEALRTYSCGMIWLGLTLDRPGAAVYFLSIPDTSTAWRRIHEWLNTILVHSEEAHRIIARLESHCHPVFVGIEGQNTETGRCKLYWRLSRLITPAQFGITMYNDPGIARFLGTIMKDHPYSFYALTFSAGFSLATGELTDIKVDLSNRSANLSVSEAITFMELQAETLGLLHPPACHGFSVLRNSVSIGFIGLGLDCQGHHRLNTYLYQTDSAGTTKDEKN